MNNTENNLIKKNFVLFLDNKKFDAEALYCSWQKQSLKMKFKELKRF